MCNDYVVALWLQRLLVDIVRNTGSGGSRKKIFGGPGPSSFGRQPWLSKIAIEPINGVLPKFRWVYARNVASSSKCWTLKARGSKRREAWGSWERVSPPQPTRRSGGALWAPPAGSGAKPPPPTHSGHISGPQNPSSRNNALRNQSKIWGGLGKIWGACAPLASA